MAGSCDRSEEDVQVLRKTLIVTAAVMPVIAISAIAQQAAIKRTPLQNADFPPGFSTVSAIAEVAPGNCAGRHTHPGLEISYVMEGTAILKIAGQPDRTMKAGDSFTVAANTPHDACAGASEPAKVLATYIVEKGKPLATPAP
jgi:quercetin dioxygenase-like cupin family protein